MANSPIIYGGTNNLGLLLPSTTGGFLTADSSGNLNVSSAVAGPLTNWVAYTPTFVGLGTVTGISFFSRRNGSNLEVKGNWTNGTVTAVLVQVSVGFNGTNAGVTVDTAQAPAASVCGVLTHQGFSSTYFGSYVLIPATNQTYVNLTTQQSTVGSTTPYQGVNWVSNDAMSISFDVPIVGWTATGTQGQKAPTVQTFTSSSGTYTTPSGPAPLYIKVRAVGAGGGGGGSGSAAGGTGGTGGNTTFGTSLVTANGGTGGAPAGAGGLGGTATLTTSGTVLKLAALAGGNGGGGFTATTATGFAGGIGAASAFGGSGGSTDGTVAGTAGATNSGAGGGGAGSNVTSINAGGGGGSGAYIETTITSPLTTYAYAIGAAGTAGTAGTSGAAGGAGGSGYIIVEEFYQ